MATSVKSGEYLTLTEACKLIPGRPHKNTVRRWMSRGGPNGKVLQSWRIGNKLLTSASAIDVFIGESQSPNPVASFSHRAAVAQLDSMGV